MKDLVALFTSQLAEAINIGKNASLSSCDKEIKNVVITGLGGSGIGGKIVGQLVANDIPVPVTINNDYHLPNFVNENTLVIASSFSGNTEETLAALAIAKNKGAEIACITSGGKVLEIAKSNNYNHIILPFGKSPRAMLTYSLTQQFFLLNHYNLIGNDFISQIRNAIELLNTEIENIKNEAKNIADSIFNKTTVIYSEANFEGVAIRFRQQLNENAKVLCWHNVLPEMNHNELVGWAGGNEEKAVIVLRNETDYYRTQTRMDIQKTVIEKHTSTYIECYSKGNSNTARALYFILLGDWVSVYLSELRNVDNIEVKIIDHLKSELAKDV
jgi:glucose/mannose-6-phosphate isomerase